MTRCTERWLVLAIVLHLAGGMARAQNAPSVPAEMKFIDDRIGTWDTDIVTKPCAQFPQGDRKQGVETTERLLGGRYLQSRNSNRPGGPDNTLLLTYDTRLKAFRYWYFDDLGNTGTGTGAWDAAKKTLTWTAEGLVGASTTGSWRFIDKDNFEWSSVTKDQDGKVLLDVTATVKRRK